MSEESRKQEYTPLNLHPFVGLDLGERWGREVGELSQRLTHVEQSVARLETKTDALHAKVEDIAHTLARHDGKFNSHEERFNSIDERFNSLEKRIDERLGGLEKRLDNNTKMLWGMFTAMLAAIIIQKFI